MYIKSYVWVFPFLSFIVGYALLYYLFYVPALETPSLIGKTLDEVIPLATRHNLNLRLLQYKEDVDVIPGTILDQKPHAYQKIKPHQSLFVVLAQKPRVPSTPYLYHKTMQDITAELAKDSITSHVYYLPSAHPENRCIAQAPAAGGALADNHIVIYLSDDTAEKTLWPDFIGKRVSDVREFLNSHEIAMEITHSYQQALNHTCQDCLVVDQRPLPGSLVNLNNTKQMLKVQLQVE